MNFPVCQVFLLENPLGANEKISTRSQAGSCYFTKESGGMGEQKKGCAFLPGKGFGCTAADFLNENRLFYFFICREVLFPSIAGILEYHNPQIGVSQGL